MTEHAADRMRVAMLPDWRQANPYQKLLATSLEALGVDVVFPQGYRRVLPFSRTLLRAPRPDVLHLHWPTPYLRSNRTVARAAYCLRTLADLWLVRRAGIRLVWTVHNLVTHDTPTPRLERWFSGRLAALADRLIVHSEAAAKAAVATLGASRAKIDVVPHGSFRSIYGEPPARSDARAILGLGDDQAVVLFFGMIRPYKGVPDLLHAWKALGERRGDALLLIVGYASDPEYASEIMEIAARVPQTRLDLRFVPDAEVPILLAAADLVVLPFAASLTSGTVRLARDYGLPVVAPLVPGTADAEGVVAVENTGPEALSQGILRGLRGDRHRDLRNEPPGWNEIAEMHLGAFSATCAVPQSGLA